MDHNHNDHILVQAKNVATLLRSLLRELSSGLDDPAVDLPLAQLRVCTVLHGGPRTMSDLGRELGVSLSAITQIADRLERAGLVARTAKGADRRVRRLELTDRGEKMMRLHEGARLQRMSAALEHLTPKQRQDVAAALQTLVHAAGAANNGRDGQDGDHERRTPHFAKSEALL
jgi:DNA-binding MarR family transcriptional regulator